MLQLDKRPAFAVIVLLASLGLAITVTAQTKAKTTPAATKPKVAAKPSAAAAQAAETYKTICQACHLVDGKGLTPDMSFTDGEWKHGKTINDHAKVISEGAPGNPLMMSFKDKLTKEEILELAKIVHAFDPKVKK